MKRIISHAFYNTPHISLNIYCTANAEALKEKFALAKGDDNFDIVVGHGGMADGIEQVGKLFYDMRIELAKG